MGGVIWWVAVGSIAIIAINKSLTYPPQNCDSLIYHLPRSLLYWKNESIHNMPFSHRRGLYGGPFNAILMTQLRIFTNGSEYLLNLIQLPSYLIACLACGEMAENFCVDRKYLLYKNHYRYISMFLMLTVPMALLQTSTTQNDLLVGSFSLITLSLLTKYLQKSEKTLQSRLYLIAAGLAGGITLLTKFNGGIVLLAGGIYFTIILLVQKGWKKTIAPVATAGLCGMSMTIGYWIRNAIDLRGDFLAWGMSANFLTVKEPAIMRLVLNIGYLFASGNEKWSTIVIQTCLKICSKFDFYYFEELSPYFEYFARGGVSVKTHDNYPYGIHMICTIGIIILVIIISIVKKDKKLGLYCMLCVMTWIFTASSMLAPKFSMSRFMLGELFMVFPLAALVWATLDKWLNNKRIIYISLNLFICLLCLGMFISGINAKLNDFYMPTSETRNRNGDKRTYEELRFGSELRGWEEPCDEFMKIILEEGFEHIGIQEDVKVGSYMMLYLLRDKKYQVQYVNAQYGAQYEDENFIPECIIGISEPDVVEDVISYNGVNYKTITERYAVLHGAGAVALYVQQ